MDPFATLGLRRRYEIDMHELETRYRELQRALHPDKHAGTSASQRRLSLENAIAVNEAYRTLKDDVLRAQALLALHGGALSANGAQPEDPEFLMEMLELREALGEAKEARDVPRVEKLKAKVESRRDAARAELVIAFDALDALPTNESARERAGALVGRLKYFRRFLDHVAGDEEPV